jgi:hypothetical protein
MNMVGLMTRDPEPAVKFALDDETYGKDRFSAVAGGIFEKPNLAKLEELVARKLPARRVKPVMKQGAAKKVAPKKAAPVKKATKAIKKATRR